MTTWQKLITQALEHNKESWDDVESMSPKKGKWLEYLFDDDFGSIEGVPFTIWTKNKRNNGDQVRDIFRAYVDAVEQPMLHLKNNHDTKLLNKMSELDIVEVISHNAAGINGKDQIEHVVMESTLNPGPVEGEWLRAQASNYLPNCTDPRRAVYEARSGYTFYQVGMRCCLRQQPPKPAHFYVIDNRAVIAMGYYFDQVDMAAIPYKSIKAPLTPLTVKERKAASYAKNRNPEKYADMNTRDILTDLESNKALEPLTREEKNAASYAKKNSPEKYAGMNTRDILKDLL